MQYVEKHLTKHHLLNAPHKWFFAFLASPIHFAEMHYKNRYHLQFSHARKLFLFDMSLLATLAVIAGAFLFWSTYNPTVTDLVYLTVTPSQSRILSGEYVTYTVGYENKSDVRLSNASITLDIPEGFILDKTEPATFDRSNNTMKLGSIGSGEKGSVSISGWFYGTPEVEDHIHAHINYAQEGKTRTENKMSPHIIFLRGSLLESSVELQEQIIENSRIPFTITLVNNGSEPLLNIVFDLSPVNTIGVLESVTTTRGLVNGGMWNLSGLLPDESVELEGIIVIRGGLGENTYSIKLAPALSIRGKTITQSTVTKSVQVARPEARVSARWDNDSAMLKPSETGRLTATITNTGSITLEQGVIEIPLPKTIVNLQEAARVNAGTVSQNTLILSSAKHPALNSISPGESRTIALLVPILAIPDGGTDTVLQPTVRFHAGVAIDPNTRVEATGKTGQLKVGTQVVFTGEIRYYTAEGDQLGRGPLPPQVGKETKYAALFSIRNTTSNVTGGILSVKLGSRAVWTGKTSVSQGSAPTYNPSTRIVRWNVGTIPAHATVGLFFEVGLTPEDEEVGTTPVLVLSAEITGTDAYLGYMVSRSIGALDTSLGTDLIGRTKGVTVR